MLQKYFKKSNRGSASIEAAVSLTMFIFVFITIFCVINFCRAQSIISHALNQTAKEMSQYSYIYEMSGLKKYDNNLSAKAGEGKTKITDVADTIDTLYGSIGAVQEKTDIFADQATKDPLTTFANLDDIDTSSLSAVNSGIDQLTNELQGISDDPILFVKELAAIAGTEALDTAKSQLIAAPLTKAMSRKHFGTNESEANEFLESLGVVNGFNGLNFKMSTIFDSSAPDDISLVVYYKLEMIDIVPFKVNASFSQTAYCRAWLGGDNPDFTYDTGENEDTSTTIDNESKVDDLTTQINLWDKHPLTRANTIRDDIIPKIIGDSYRTANSAHDFYNSGTKTFTKARSMDTFATSNLKDDDVKKTIRGYIKGMISPAKTGYSFSCFKNLDQVLNDGDDGKIKFTYSSSDTFNLYLIIPSNGDVDRITKLANEVKSEFKNNNVTVTIYSGYGEAKQKQSSETAEDESSKIANDESSETVDESTKGKITLSEKTIEEQAKVYALQATQEGKSNKVVLGSYDKNDRTKSYDTIAKSKDATYFYLENWNQIESTFGQNNMWLINKEFLNNQWNAGKEFYFSHNPWEAKGDTFFEKECLYLIDLGVKDFVKTDDNLWKAIIND